MDIMESVEDLFSKLHPCFPIQTRIGIVGAGPSGLSAAYALCKLGYSNVTVLEKQPFVGGMCESADIEGRTYDLGGQVLAANSAPTISHLAKEIGAEWEDMNTPLALIDSSRRTYGDLKLVEDFVSMIPLTLKFQDKANVSGYIGVHGVSNIASDLAPEFVKDHGLKSVPESVSYGYSASGYGFVQDMPYAYVHEFTRTSLAGRIRRFRGGYMSFWQKLSKRMPIEVHCKTEVTSVRRHSAGVTVTSRDESGGIQDMEFDKIIISGAFPFINGNTYRSPFVNISESENQCLDMSMLEKELFSKVKTIDYYTTVLQIRGFNHFPKGFYYFEEFTTNPVALGNPVAMQRFYGDTDIFLFWSYGNSADIKGPKVTELAKSVVRSMGGEVKKVILQRRFKYFPHVSSQDMKDGFYDKLEFELQGQHNTYFVGGLMAFELTERNASYAMALIQKHFADNGPVPNFPYAKRLFPLKSKCEGFVKHLDECPGVNFPDLSSLDSYLNHWGNHNVTGDKNLYTWINENGEKVAQRTYKELCANASAIAYKLLTSKKPIIKPGDRVLLVYLPGLDFVDAFFGCLRARVIPVPVIPPDPLQRGRQALLHISNINKSCCPISILSTFNYHIAVRAASAKNFIMGKGRSKFSLYWPDLPWLHTDAWVKKSKISMDLNGIANLSEPKSDDLCFLQFTSGSTGEAKGVMITHGGLIHNVKLMRRRYKSTSKTILVSWLPQYHDMGLIGGLFTTMVSGSSAILFSPITFIKDPLFWLQTISNYQATHSAGPNFAFELVVRRLELNTVRNFNLCSLVFLMVAAEPISSKALKRFVKLTQPFGLIQDVISPGYGLAENCVFVNCAYGEGKPILLDWQGRVCCGYVNLNDNDVKIKIVDPETIQETEESEKEGEIWISSPSAGVGYWGMEELSEDTFRNKLPSDPDKKYLRTGDLGRIMDGNLFITGRIKDLIIVAGRNIYSSDVEKTVESSSKSLRPGCCAVVSIPRDILQEKGLSLPDVYDEVGLVVIAEVRENECNYDYLIKQIESCVAEEHGVIVASTVLVKPKSISKTTSGKIKRFECAKNFIDGTLNVIAEPFKRERSTQHQERKRNLSTKKEKVSKEDIIEFLKQLLSEQTGISITDISITESLVSYGVDSIGVVRAAQRLSDFLGAPVGAIDIFTATCIEDLANFAQNLLVKTHPESLNTLPCSINTQFSSLERSLEVSSYQKFTIWLAQLLALAYVSFLLILPAYLSVSAFTYFLSASCTLIEQAPWTGYLFSLAFAPLSWMACIFSTCFFLAFLGNSFLQPNYCLNSEISIWSSEFVKWWALYKAQEVSSEVLATYLRGTVFINYWFQMLGAKIATSALLDAVDITDPSLVSIGKDAVIAEGALLQSHEMKNGILRFSPIRIGQKSFVGPYAVITRGSTVGDGTEVLPLHTSEQGKSDSQKLSTNNCQKGKLTPETRRKACASKSITHFFGIYMLGFLSSLSAAIPYLIYIWITEKQLSLPHFGFVCISGAFHWLPYTLVAYAAMLETVPSSPASFAFLISTGYTVHGLTFSFFTSILNSLLHRKKEMKENDLKIWICHLFNVACHVRFAKFLSGTEAFAIYLRLLGAKIGQNCSIRAINPVLDPQLISVGNGVHLGDFSRITPGYHSQDGYICEKIKIQDNSVLGSQSLVLPGSIIERNVILGAISVAPTGSVLQRGGIYVGTEAPVMVKNISYSLDDRLEEIDTKYKKVLGNLAASLAGTTLKVNSRYFHRIGVAGKGVFRLYDHIPGFPDHKIFSPGKKYPIIIRHSNCLSSDDDARLDPRGAAIRILSNETDERCPLIDLTLKTGKAFHARSIGDFAVWLVCGAAAREEHVKHAPHIRDAMWGSLRRADSYTELHYYSNICRLFRFKNGEEMYVKFKLRPFNENIDEDSGMVEPMGILPPETGAIPRDENDKRPLLFLADDFQRRVNSPDGVRYILQLQFRAVPEDDNTNEIALDCTKPWDDTEIPYIEVGEIVIDQMLTKEESDHLEFNPFFRCHEIDVIRATSCNQSASIDHGRSVVYEICQHLRNRKPLPESWRIFLDQSDVKVDLSGCPMVAKIEKNGSSKLTLAQPWYITLWLMIAQPFLQTFLPYFLMGLVIFFLLKFVCINRDRNMLLLPLFWICSGLLGGFLCTVAKWVLVGKKKEGETEQIWSASIFKDTIWQAIRTLVGEYFMKMTSGSFLFGLWMKSLGSEIAWNEGVYVDSMGALLNPEMVKVKKYGCVEREALLFGHIYEGEEGKVKYGEIEIGNGGFVGSRAMAMPGVTLETGGSLAALTLAMKEEIIK